MSLKVKDKQLLKIYNKIQKEIERLMSIDLAANLLMTMMINT